mmetsp:Transcript_5059/g.12442  ORF Transcript_5059/g.12442 Transcript_5059/m.12442 type:complete len:81 (-) Transcript_5059:777-1019(-)
MGSLSKQGQQHRKLSRPPAHSSAITSSHIQGPVLLIFGYGGWMIVRDEVCGELICGIWSEWRHKQRSQRPLVLQLSLQCW